MIIKKANINDAEEILALQKICYITEAEIYSDYTISPLVQTLEEIKAHFEDYHFLKLVESGKIIGSIKARESSPVTCYIGRLIVHPDFQNRGNGTMLMERIEGIFNECKKWELIAGYKSEKNIKFYEKRGYHIYKTEKISSKISLIYMEKLNK